MCTWCAEAQGTGGNLRGFSGDGKASAIDLGLEDGSEGAWSGGAFGEGVAKSGGLFGVFAEEVGETAAAGAGESRGEVVFGEFEEEDVDGGGCGAWVELFFEFPVAGDFAGGGVPVAFEECGAEGGGGLFQLVEEE